MKIAHISFAGYAAATNRVVLNDKNGFLVWEGHGSADLTDQNSFKIGWVNGLTPQQIDSGQVVVYIE
jgi:hypothetical protein